MNTAREIRNLWDEIGRIKGRVAGSSSGAVKTFLGLNDTPAAYAGAALKNVRVNAGTNALEFVAEAGADQPGRIIFDEDFSGLALGDINGQGAYSFAGTWVNNSGAGCTATVVADPAGGQMLRLHDASAVNAAEAYIILDPGIEVLSGIVEWKMKVDVQAVGSRGYFFFIDSGIASSQGGYFRGDDTSIWYRTAAGATAKLCNAAVDTWFTVKMYFCRLADYAVWWVDDVFTQNRLIVGAGDKFNKILLYTRDIHSGQDFDIKYIKVWSLNYTP